MEKKREVNVNIRLGLTVSGAIILAMLALSAFAWTQLPADASIAIHWGISGEADGFANKTFALLIVPAVTIFVAGLLAVVPSFEPRKLNLGKSGKYYLICWIGSLLIEFVAHACIVLTALSIAVPVMQVISISIGLLFAVIGNYMGKVRSNYHFGIRTPWTLESEYSWHKTHRLAGWLFVITGLSTVVAGFSNNGGLIVSTILGGTSIIVVGTVAYSYLMWKKDPDKKKVQSEDA